MPSMARKPYPSDVTDEEWSFVAPYLTLMTETRRSASTRSATCSTRSAGPSATCGNCCGCWLAGLDPLPSAAVLDSRTVQSTPESSGRGGYDGAKRRKGSKVHAAGLSTGPPARHAGRVRTDDI